MVQDIQIVPHIQVEEQVETERILSIPVLQEPALEHSEVVEEEQNPTLDHPIYLFLNHLEVEVDQVVDLEAEDQNLPIVEV